MYETRLTGPNAERDEGRVDEVDDGVFETLRLGHDVRFVLVVVGGGAVRIGQEIARRHPRYLETVAVNCDARVQELEEFDRRVFLGSPSSADSGTGGSPSVGSRLARAAEPALDRIFEGATFVTVVASLGGGSGTGALPSVLESAARSAEFVSVFVVKPFRCEGDRRAVAERAIARLHFIDAFVEKQERRHGSLQVLDNETLVRNERGTPFNQIGHHWADLIATHIEQSFVAPIEAAVEARRLGIPPESEPIRGPTPVPSEPAPVHTPEPPFGPIPISLQMNGEGPGAADAELTFEILSSSGGPEGLP